MTQSDINRSEFLQRVRASALDKSLDGDLEGSLLEIDNAIARMAPLSDSELGFVWRVKSKLHNDHFRFEETVDFARKSSFHYSLSGESLEAAKSRVVEVHALGYLEKLAEANTLYLELIPVLEGFTLGLIFLQANLGRAYMVNWDNAIGLDHLLKARSMALTESFDEVATYINMDVGLALEQLGRLQDAKLVYEETYSTLLDDGEAEDIMKVTFNLASILLKLGYYEQALVKIEEARQNPIISRDTDDIGYISQFEGRIRSAIGEHDLAAELFKSAADIFQKFEREVDLAETAMLLGQLLGLSPDLESQQSGLEYLDLALERLPAGKYQLLYGRALLYQSKILCQLGKLNEAYQQSLAAYKIFDHLATSTYKGIANCQLAIIEMEQGEAVDNILSRLITNEEILEQLPRDTAIETLYLMGVLCSDQNRLTEAKQYLIRGFDSAESYRNQASRHEHQAALGRKISQLGGALLDVLHRLPEEDDNDSKLLETLENLRASGLKQLIGFLPKSNIVQADGFADLLEKREALKRQLDQIDQITYFDVVKDPITSQGRLLREQQQSKIKFDLLHTFKRVDEEISRKIKDVRLEYQVGLDTKIDLSQILNDLSQDGMAIHFYELDGALWVLGVNLASRKIEKVKLTVTLEDVLVSWKLAARFLQPKHARRGMHKKLAHRLGQLYGMLIGPIKCLFDDDQLPDQLIIMPAPELWEIPFAGLYDPMSEVYLVDQTQLTIAPSLNILASFQAATSTTQPVMAIGYGGDPNALDFLPAVAQELDALQRLYGEQVRLISGEHAVPDDIYDQLADTEAPSILHVATHIDYDPNDPMGSGIRLAKKERLTAADLYVRPGLLNGSLVVLSGCDSGRVKPTGTELLGLNSGILYAGARGIISSLWPVSDEATLHFMQAFYAALQKRTDEPAWALQQAILTMKGDPRFESPYYWAPFYYSGS